MFHFRKDDTTITSDSRTTDDAETLDPSENIKPLPSTNSSSENSLYETPKTFHQIAHNSLLQKSKFTLMFFKSLICFNNLKDIYT